MNVLIRAMINEGDLYLGNLLRGVPAAPPPGTGGRSHSRTKWSGTQLRLIRAKGQARECARRRRQAEARS
ncbi:MAG: hypothetical protein B7Z40_12130 [Bosea sp. 12-68-7]|nr:MAG: hypothetical protein B7Z40_12130 [Bosea sp. 12-68-7]OYX02350.1 MAG: hypothetical protein B7Z14_03640 [Bosea sp. 32-68-6]